MTIKMARKELKIMNDFQYMIELIKACPRIGPPREPIPLAALI
jgi:hypothetical protein